MGQRRVDLRREYGPRRVRLTSVLDEESSRFEEELRGLLAGKAGTEAARELPWLQSHAYLELSPREFRLLQTRDAAGAPSAQIAVFLARPRRAPWLASATADRFGPATDGEEEEFALKVLRDLFLELGEAVTLRLRPERFDLTELRDFQERAGRAGFHLTDALDVTRTLVCDLRPSDDERLAALSRKVRVNFSSPDLETVDIRVLQDRRYIPQCRAALNAAFDRTVGAGSHFDFETAFSYAARHPDRAAVLGLFMKDRPETLLAYSTGFRSGASAEYSSAGSVKDPALRALPFNYWLLWDLMRWAKKGGASFFDLRGVTSGGASDPLAGISFFKRRFPSRETEVNREMTTVLKPTAHALLSSLEGLRARAR
jgi:hypothetical protein